MRYRANKEKIQRYFGDGCYLQKSVSVQEVNAILKYGTDIDDNQKPPIDTPTKKQDNCPDNCPNSALNSLLSSEGKLLQLYEESTPSQYCYVSDLNAAYALKFHLRKIEYLKKKLREKGYISYSIFDSDIEEFYFILRYR